MRKAFTLSEALVTLAIIGVLAAILIPVIDTKKPDKDKVTYKKALYSMQSAVSQAMDNLEYQFPANVQAYWKDEHIEDPDFCLALADALNTSGKVDCVSTSSYEHPNFVTTDGIRYWGLEGKFGNEDFKQIYVDRNLSSGELLAIDRARDGKNASGLQIRVRYDGKVDVPEPDNKYNTSYENELIENSMDMTTGRPKTNTTVE